MKYAKRTPKAEASKERRPEKKTRRTRPADAPPERDQLLQELQVQQEELEAQNQELRQAHQLLEESRNRYADLYDLGPIGYVTLNGQGLIQEINLPGAAVLGVERSRLIGLPFGLYVLREDKHILPVFPGTDCR